MCIVFVYVNNDVIDDDEYQVIIAMNREEFIDRPTLPAHFWNEHCISGVDALHGRNGGTWLGVSSKFAKIGALLNIAEVHIDTTKRPRGHLVPDYLQTQLEAAEYMKTVAQRQDEFNPLNLVLLERREDDWFVHCLCNQHDTSPTHLHLSTGIQVVSNSPIDRPWQKVSKGREKFEQIVSRHRHRCTREELKDDLIGMLSDRSSNIPDPVLESQLTTVLTGPDTADHVVTGRDLLARRSAIFVDLYDTARYGTRTHTLLLVDKSGHCEYVEMTLNTNVAKISDSLSADHRASVNSIQSSDWLTTQVDFRFA